MKKQIVCINWGTKYGPPFINRLYGMASRNITGPFRFVCFTDNYAGIRDEVEKEPLPDLDCNVPKNTKGIWQKARLWGEKLGDLQGPVLFLDLDLVITGNIDQLFDYGNQDDVILSQNQVLSLGRFGQPERRGQTSVFRFPVGKLKTLQDIFKKDPSKIAEKYIFEQRFVTTNTPGGVKFYPKKWVRHFRQNCTQIFPLNYFLPPGLPNKAKIIIFPGGVHPTHVIQGRWGEAAISERPLKHILKAFKPGFQGRRFAHLRHFILQPKWVEKNWRE